MDARRDFTDDVVRDNVEQGEIGYDWQLDHLLAAGPDRERYNRIQ